MTNNFVLYKISHIVNSKLLKNDNSYHNNIYFVKGYNISEKIYEQFIMQLKNSKINYIEESKLTNYNYLLQKQKYFAPTFLYHSYLNPDIIIKNNNFIGLIEYGIDYILDCNESLTYNKNLNIDKNNFNLYNEINKIINLNFNNDFILFFSVRHKLNDLNKQNFITINNIHWLDYFIQDYNKRFKKIYKKNDILKEYGNQMIGTQQSFLSSKYIFFKISKYINEFINDNINNNYYPMPSTLLERFIAMFLLLENCNKYYIPLKHNAIGFSTNYNY